MNNEEKMEEISKVVYAWEDDAGTKWETDMALSVIHSIILKDKSISQQLDESLGKK